MQDNIAFVICWKQGKSKDPVVVFIRHGRTPHNNLGLFTGWEDPPLAPDGVEDAKNAGKLLKLHGFEFDVVYTSWLTRAIETACKCIAATNAYDLSLLHNANFFLPSYAQGIAWMS